MVQVTNWMCVQQSHQSLRHSFEQIAMHNKWSEWLEDRSMMTLSMIVCLVTWQEQRCSSIRAPLSALLHCISVMTRHFQSLRMVNLTRMQLTLMSPVCLIDHLTILNWWWWVVDCQNTNNSSSCSSQCTEQEHCGWCVASSTCSTQAFCASSQVLLDECLDISVSPSTFDSKFDTTATIIVSPRVPQVWYSAKRTAVTIDGLYCYLSTGDSIPAIITNETTLTCDLPKLITSDPVIMTIKFQNQTLVDPIELPSFDCSPFTSCETCLYASRVIVASLSATNTEVVGQPVNAIGARLDAWSRTIVVSCAIVRFQRDRLLGTPALFFQLLLFLQ